ncbi:MAG: TolC family protein [Balneolia bacterium]|nr:TolC family protein [Balneolia bacterium]
MTSLNLASMLMLLFLGGQPEGAPQPAEAAKQLTLETAARHALEFHPELRIQNLESEISELERKRTLQTFLPRVTLQSRYTWLDEPVSIGVPDFSLEVMPGLTLSPDLPDIQLQDDRFFNASMQVEQVLFTGFRVTNAAKAMRHKTEALEFLKQAGEAELLAALTESWDRVMLLNASLGVLNEAETRLDYEYTKAQGAYENGLIPYYDLSALRSHRQELRSRQAELRGKRDLMFQELSYITGINTDEFTRAEFDYTNSDLSALIVQGDMEMPNGQPPEIKALESRIQAQRSASRAAQGGYAPEVFAFYNKELYEDDLSILEPVRAMGVGARWTIFNRGQTTRLVQIASRELRAAQLELEHATRGFEVKTEQALINSRVAEEKAITARLYREEAETGLRLAQRRYELGLSDISEHLQAETDFRRAALMEAEANYLLRRAEVDMALATGSLRLR